MKIRLLIASLCASWACCASDTHTHGAGDLLVAQEGKAWVVQLHLPAADVFGFEHSPETDTQRAHIQQMAETFSNVSQVVRLQGQCQLVDTKSTFDALLHEKPEEAETHAHEHEAHGHEHHDHDQEQHSDLEIAYHFTCAGKVTSLSVQLFSWLPTMQTLESQWITDQGQGALTLNRQQPDIRW